MITLETALHGESIRFVSGGSCVGRINRDPENPEPAETLARAMLGGETARSVLAELLELQAVTAQNLFNARFAQLCGRAREALGAIDSAPIMAETSRPVFGCADGAEALAETVRKALGPAFAEAPKKPQDTRSELDGVRIVSTHRTRQKARDARTSMRQEVRKSSDGWHVVEPIDEC